MSIVKKKMNVALLAFVDGQGKIMLNRRADAAAEMWEFIGGGVEAGESPLDAIKREISEEVGYMLQATDNLVFLETFQYESEKVSATVHAFKAKYPGTDTFSDSDETFVADLKLFTVGDALALPLLPMTRLILERDLLSQ